MIFCFLVKLSEEGKIGMYITLKSNKHYFGKKLTSQGYYLKVENFKFTLCQPMLLLSLLMQLRTFKVKSVRIS